MWYPAKVVKKQKDVLIKWLDGGSTATIATSAVKPYNWKIFIKVECKWSKDDNFYRGQVAELYNDGVTIRWDDGGNKEGPQI